MKKAAIREPKYKDGDEVIFNTQHEQTPLRIKGDPAHNGRTWMYGFEDCVMRCGEEYLKPKIA